MTDTTIPAGVSSGGLTVNSGDNLFIYGTGTNITVSNGGNEDIYNGGSAVGTTVSSGGNEYVYSGGSAISTVAISGGVEAINAGGSASFTTATEGGDVFVLSGMLDQGLIGPGGNLNVDNGGSATSTTVSGGSVYVYSGGTAFGTTISAGGNLYLNSAGTASFTTVSGTGNDTVLFSGSAVSTTLLNGGTETVDSGGSASFAAVSSGGYQYVYSGGAAFSTTVFAGGRQNVVDGGVTSFTTVSTGGNENIFSGSVASDTTVSYDGSLNVGSYGTTSFTVVSNGGSEFVYSGGTAFATTVDQAGFQIVSGTASYTVLSGGTEVTSDGGVSISATVSNGGHETASAGGTTSFTTVSFGGGEFVEISGAAVSTTVGFGGYQIISGGSATGTEVERSGIEQVQLGGVTTFTMVSSGGAEFVYTGGTASSATVDSAGGLFVYSGGEADFANLSAGAVMVVLPGGTQSGTTGAGSVVSTGVVVYQPALSGTYTLGSSASGVVLSGIDIEFVLSGGVATSTTLSGGGTVAIYAGGSAVSTFISGAGRESVSAGGTASFTTVSGGGNELVYSGGVTYSTTVDAYAAEFVFSGGIASSTTVEYQGEIGVLNSGVTVSATVDAGFEYVSSGGVASATTVSNGGQLIVEYGGSAVFATISGFGVDAVAFSGIAISTQLLDAREYIYNAGTTSFTSVHKGGEEYVLAGGSAVSATVSSGGAVFVFSGGSAVDATVDAGGYVVVFPGGMQTGTTGAGSVVSTGVVLALSGAAISAFASTTGTSVGYAGTEYVLPNGVTTRTTVYGGGFEYVYAGGKTISTTVSNGGNEYVSSGATASFTTVSSGGTDTVSAGGATVSTIVDSGGQELIVSGGTAYGAVLSSGTQSVTMGGSAVGTVISRGGFQSVGLGATALDATVSSGGSQYIYVGGSAVSTTVGFGGVEHMLGGVTTGTTVQNGGLQYVYSGDAISTTVSAGGELRVEFGTTSNAMIGVGGREYVDYGGTTVDTTLSGGTEYVSVGGMAISTTVSSGGFEYVSAGGSASYTTVSNGGSALVYGTVVSETVLSGGTETVQTDGAARETAVSSGGVQNVYGHTSVVSTTITQGGVAFVLASGTTTGTVISSGGAEILSSGASASGTVLSNGGILVVLPGATQTGTVSSGGQVVSTGVVLYQPGSGASYYPGATASHLTVSTSSPFTSATEYVLSGGTATSNTVGPNGYQLIFGGGSALDTTMSGNAFRGGTQYVYSGGSATSTFVTAESIEDVYSGGATSFTTVSGGEELVFVGGKSVDTTLKANAFGGGIETVEGAFNGGVASSGVAISTTISSGGHEIISFFGVASNTIVSSGGYEVVSANGSATDTTIVLGGHIDLAGLRFVSGATSAFVDASDVLSVTDGTSVYTQQLLGNYAGVYFNTSAGPLTGLDTLVTASETPCYCRGTHILTDRGEIAVEDLRIADRLVTVSGTVRPIRWIGRRSYAGRFAAGNAKVLPILFRAGALADDVPRRDLLVSPQHAMFVDGVLIPAVALVNGSSIVQLEAVDKVEYFHLELDTHDVILAEGAAAETFVDDDSRGMFHNAAEFRLLYPDAPRIPARYCAPRLEDGAALEAVRSRLAGRATAAASAVGAPGLLRGHVDHVGRDGIRGWAQGAADPGKPVRLRILDNDVAIGEAVADRYRDDLARQGIGGGQHAFAFAIPGGLSPLQRHVIRVQRAEDGAELAGSPWLVDAVPAVLQVAAPGGALRGHLDIATHDRITGWAQDAANPSAPVALQIIDNGVVLTRVLANMARDDLAAAGVGDGRHGFDLLIPGGLSPLVRHVIQVRRDGDGAELPQSPAVIEASGAFDSGLQRSIARAVASADSPDEQARVLSFMLCQADRLRQQRADADAGRGERLTRHRLSRRLGPSAPQADPARRALVIDTRVPEAGRDAGSAAMLSHMRALAGMGYAVSFAAADAMTEEGAAVDALRDAGFGWCGAPFYASAEEVMRRQAGCFELVYLHRAPIATRYLALARRYLPKARILYSVADLHHVRLERQAAAEDRPELLAASQRQRLEECMAALSADAVLTHSADEAAILRQLVPEASVYRVPWAVPERQAATPFAARHGVAFIGGYGHAPNVDAARWLVDEVMPLVWRAAPHIRCVLAGSEMPPVVRRLQSPLVSVVGAVADVAAVFDRARLTAAPLRYGAGVKGKVLDSLASGVPCIMSPIAAEGLDLSAPLRALVGEDAAAMAALIRRLHDDEAAHAAAAAAGRAMIRARHDAASVAAALRDAVEGRRAMAATAAG
jgi:autotransporter passenger strand-loop-strand repeat protein